MAVDAPNVVVVRVTAEDGLTGNRKYYRVTVNRASSTASNDATLGMLMVDPGMTDNPATLGTKFEYSIDLPYDFVAGSDVQNEVDITVEASQAAAGAVVTVKKGGEVIATGDLDDVAIDEGDNTITVDVLAPDFVATKTYTLTINRARRNASDDDRLSSLSLSQGMLMPAFDPAKLPTGDNGNSDGTSVINAHPYAVSVPHSVFEVTVMAATTDSRAKWEVTTPMDSDSTRNGHQVNVTATTTEINIMATAEDRTTEKFYQVIVTRAVVGASTTATLSTLSVTPAVGGTPWYCCCA